MRENLLVTMSIMINERLEEINMSDYEWDLSELNDPVINTILELRKIVFANSPNNNAFNIFD
jgi:hypothetical protein